MLFRSASNLSSRFSQAYLYCHSSHLYSDENLLTFELHKSFPSLNNSTVFKMAPNFIRSINQSLSSSLYFNAQDSNAPNQTQVASIPGLFTVYIVDEYKLECLQLISFSTDKENFLTVVAKFLLTMSLKRYKHLILDVLCNGGRKIMLSNHLVIFLYSYAFPTHAGFEYPQSLTNTKSIHKYVD